MGHTSTGTAETFKFRDGALRLLELAVNVESVGT